MLTTLQPVAVSAVAPAGTHSGQHFFCPAASSSAPSAVVQPAAAQAVPPLPQVPEYRVWGDWVVTWQVKTEVGKGQVAWIDYDEEFQKKLEEHYKQSRRSFRAVPGQAVAFKYNTEKMYQFNMETKKKRLMRRCLVYKDEWLQMDGRLREHEDDNSLKWDPGPSYDRRGGKAAGKAGWKVSRSRSSPRRRF